MGAGEWARAEARGGNEPRGSQDWREGFGGWITEAERESPAMRQEGKVWAAPGMRGRGGELRSSRGYDVWRLENSRLAAPKEHGSEEWPGYLKSQRGSSANPGIRKGSVDQRGENQEGSGDRWDLKGTEPLR